MKNILLVTDFTVQSLWPIHNIVKDAGSEKLCIQVVHMLAMPTDITDLLWLKSNKPYKAIPEQFQEAFQLLHNKYRRAIERMHVRFLYGSTTAILNHHIENGRFDKVYLLGNYDYVQPFYNSVNCAALLKDNCKAPVHRLPLHDEAFSNYQILSALLAGAKPEESPTPAMPFKRTISFS